MIHQRDLTALYGTPGSPEAKAHMKIIDLSEFDIGHVAGYLKDGKFYGHEALEQPLKKAFQCLQDNELLEELETWDGCYNVRKMSSGRSWSVHSWGLAIDLNAADNGYGDEPSFSEEFVECFENAGFTWGGRWQTPDGMHFQLPVIP